jgi:ADP-ribosylglycohydrolase
MPGWDKLRSLIANEWAQLREEGRDEIALAKLRHEFNNASDDESTLRDIWQRALALPIPVQLEQNEPNDLASIQALRPQSTLGARQFMLSYDDEELFNRMYGAWLGRCAGCALGKPVEGFMDEHNGIASKERIKKYLQAIDAAEYPLNNYFPQHSPAQEQTGRVWCHPSTREQIAFMESDDDIRYTVLGQLVMLQHGKNFTTQDVAIAWMQYLPYKFVCTAETQAYRNLVMRYEFHLGKCEEVDWQWVATHENPYREWIGAQIRADSWGYAAPGNPELAADFAWRDARLSHVRNGIYGEMFCAAMIAAAFALDNPQQIVEAGLAEIPQHSRLYREMRQVVEICAKYHNDWTQFEVVLDEIYTLLGHYHAVHTNNNAGIVVAALLLGGHDLEKAITLAVMGGWDSDCNGATVGSIAGAMLGAKVLEDSATKWIEPLHDTLNSEIIGYHPIAISECARRSVQIAQKVRES